MTINSVTAIAHPNIALIKYWGDQDSDLHIPANSSISMNLDGLFTRTSASLSGVSEQDTIIINGQPAVEIAQVRITQFINRFRSLFGVNGFFDIESENNFPSNVGIASSASAYAALSLAICEASGLNLNEAELSRLARLGSGSACRSIPGGFVEWQAGNDNQSSFAYSIAPPAHWDLVDCIAIINKSPKEISSLEGHALAGTSPLQNARVANTEQRLMDCRQAILERDFESLARVIELDSNMMHAVMMTSKPPIIYWHPATISIMRLVVEWRKQGLPVCYTIDAGPNVHVLCEECISQKITDRLNESGDVLNVIISKAGDGAKIDEQNCNSLYRSLR